MLAIVKSAKSVRASLKYNEKKVEQKQAHLLDAHNFWQDKSELSPRDKLQRFHDLTVLNQRSQKHAIHISLNFPAEDRLSDAKMTRIATDFMRGIDFAEQPWLAYRHVDAGHPHMHIVTTNIRPDGSRITNDLRSPDHLKQLCYTLEEKHDLTPALRMPNLFSEEQKPARQKSPEGETLFTYGKAPTKTGIARVLDHVVHRYAFTSIESYNAVLSEYRVRADRGRENSPMYKNQGLYYRALDEDGKKIGAPIKASAFQQPVTLPHLQEKFRLNEAKVIETAESMRNRIDYRIFTATKPYSLAMFKEELFQDGINIVIPKPRDSHGFFYVDHDSKTAVRDTQLGDRYTAAAIFERTGIGQDIRKLVAKNRLLLTGSEQLTLLQPPQQQSAETLQILFKLADRHDQIVDKRLSRMQEQQQSQRQGRGLHF